MLNLSFISFMRGHFYTQCRPFFFLSFAQIIFRQFRRIVIFARGRAVSIRCPLLTFGSVRRRTVYYVIVAERRRRLIG